MKEEEDVASYFMRFNEIVNSIIGLGATVKEKVVVQKIMRALPTCFNLKVSSLEDRSDLDDLTKDELYGILTTYEMRIEPKNEPRKVGALK